RRTIRRSDLPPKQSPAPGRGPRSAEEALMTFRARPVLVCLMFAASAGTGCMAPSRSNSALNAAHHEAGELPQTCAEVREQMLDHSHQIVDGQYKLFVQGDPEKPWMAYCMGMRWNSPSEFLAVQESNNYSQLSDGVGVVTTSFRSYRID